MDLQLVITLTERMAVIAVVAYIFTRTRLFRSLLQGSMSLRQRLYLALFFGLLSISGTYLGVPINGAIANSRVIGAGIAGLLGGPMVGLMAGLMGGIHRYFVGGFTAFACGLSTTLEGLAAGLIRHFLKTHRVGWPLAFATGIVTEAMQMGIIIAVARPLEAAIDLVSIIGWPMIIVNSVGMAIFMLMVESVVSGEEKISAFQTNKVLSIARQTMPYLREGLNKKSATQAARIILQNMKIAAVSITDSHRVLVHMGKGRDHHLPGTKLPVGKIRQVIQEGKTLVAKSKSEVGCSTPTCPLSSSVVVPLRCRDRIIGALMLYQDQEESITPVDIEFVSGMAQLFSTHLELAELERQAQLATEARLKGLQAQINPHFLFNSLNTIVSFCRTDVEMARKLIVKLADFLRHNLYQGNQFVTLDQEMEHVNAYLELERARAGERLEIREEIDPELLEVRLPSLIIQPLVENAVKHGILPNPGGGTVTIRARTAGREARISVHDTGQGIPVDRLKTLLSQPRMWGKRRKGGIGLVNVNERLVSIYGPEYCLRIETNPGSGTTVHLVIPMDGKEVVAS